MKELGKAAAVTARAAATVDSGTTETVRDSMMQKF